MMWINKIKVHKIRLLKEILISDLLSFNLVDILLLSCKEIMTETLINKPYLRNKNITCQIFKPLIIDITVLI